MLHWGLMKRSALIVALTLFPIAAFALDFTDVSSKYADAPFSQPVAAGVSVLTNLGAVQGNPDGTFAPNRTVNRAEFLKIAFLSNSSISVSASDSARCFPDVHAADWFSRYVCLAKVRKTVGGYPDGQFRPENAVNYAEALKMLGEMYHVKTDLDLASPLTWWYFPYQEGAKNAGLDLVSLHDDMQHLLTRGEVVQLVASYRAYHDGQLAEYRAFERGEMISSVSSSFSSVSTSSSSTSSASSQSSSVSSVSSSSAQPSSSSLSTQSSTSSIFPAVSHFLIVGGRTPAVFNGTFTSPDEDAVIRIVDVSLRREIKSISSMTLVDAAGNAIGTLILNTDNNPDRRKWRMVLADNGGYTLKKGVPTQIGVELNLYPRLNGGVANEFMDGIDSFSITVNGLATSASKSLVPAATSYPSHQTTDGRITAVTNAGSGASTLKIGSNKILGQFAVSAETTTGGLVSLASMEFTLQSTDASVTNIRIGGPSPVQQAGCGVDTVQSSHVVCSVIPDAFQALGKTPIIITVYGDVSLRTGSNAGSLQIIFSGPGQVGQSGAIHWQDDVGHYNWLESTVPLQNGTAWTVSQ